MHIPGQYVLYQIRNQVLWSKSPWKPYGGFLSKAMLMEIRVWTLAKEMSDESDEKPSELFWHVFPDSFCEHDMFLEPL